MVHSKPKHTVGELKQVKRFAFFPMIIKSRLVWLKRYTAVKRYTYNISFDEMENEYVDQYYWQTIERKLIRR